MRLLKFLLAALFAAFAMAAGLLISLGLMVVGFVISLGRRGSGRHPRPPHRAAPRRTRVAVRPAADDAIDVVVTEVPTAEASVRRVE